MKMKRSLFLIIAMALTGQLLMAQSPIFIKGDNVLNLGIGFGSALYTGTGYTSRIPALSASFEYGVAEGIADKGSIGIGGYLGYTSAKYEVYNGWGFKYSDLIIGPRGSFHYPFLEKFDTYTGLLLGYDIVTAKEYGDKAFGYNYSASSSKLRASWFIGGRYYFNEKFAGLVELGFGIAYLNLGVAIKL
jgi:hypothetical protein